jgi:hypothetical protein
MHDDFREVTDKLGLDARTLAKALNVPVQSLRQMRADPGTTAYRSPPEDWKRVIGGIARTRALELLKIANELYRSPS